MRNLRNEFSNDHHSNLNVSVAADTLLVPATAPPVVASFAAACSTARPDVGPAAPDS